MNQLGTWILLLAVTAVALAATRINPITGYSRRRTWLLALLAVLGTAFIVGVALYTPSSAPLNAPGVIER